MIPGRVPSLERHGGKLDPAMVLVSASDAAAIDRLMVETKIAAAAVSGRRSAFYSALCTGVKCDPDVKMARPPRGSARSHGGPWRHIRGGLFIRRCAMWSSREWWNECIAAE